MDENNRSYPLPGDDEEWVPDEAINQLNFEYSMHPEDVNKPEQMARRLLREALPQVTLGLIHTAIHSPDSRVRLNAASMILDRTLGKATQNAFDGDMSPIELLGQELMDNVEALLASTGAETEA